jgi:SAM-dependent methyltransferase
VPQIAKGASVTGIDLTEAYVEFARSRNTNPYITFRAADARALPFEDNPFDRAFSMLLLQFIRDAARAVAEMRRVVQPGGTVTAAVWDAYGGTPHTRMVWDIAAVLDPSIERPLPLSQPNEMANLRRDLGFVDVEQTSLLIRIEFSGFNDYWLPMTGEGPLVQFITGLSPPARATLTEHVRRAYVANLPDGPRSFACVAWACRGTVPP